MRWLGQASSRRLRAKHMHVIVIGQIDNDEPPGLARGWTRQAQASSIRIRELGLEET